MIPKICDGFALQKGATFGFGPTADDDTGKVTKICNIDEDELAAVNQTDVHNIRSQRKVGEINYMSYTSVENET